MARTQGSDTLRGSHLYSLDTTEVRHRTAITAGSLNIKCHIDAPAVGRGIQDHPL